ncbi:MAG: response regulator [Myxococcales bacterium]|nr:response regulator [Myxococcales bacterium]
MLALLVEEQSVSASELQRALESVGFAVEIANSGRHGVQRALHLRPDIVFLDRGIPQMTSWEAAQRIRAHAPHTSTRVIRLTRNQKNEMARCIGKVASRVSNLSAEEVCEIYKLMRVRAQERLKDALRSQHTAGTEPL